MARHATWRATWVLLAIAGLSACAGGRRQNPVASNEEIGQITDEIPMAPPEEKSQFYITQEGDTLKGISGRPEIFGDPNLWPLILDANADIIGPDHKVPVGVQLRIPREMVPEQLADARERARQDAIASKKGIAPPKPKVAHATAPSMPRHARKVATAQPTPDLIALDSEAKEVHKKKGGFGTLLIVLLLMLAALALILLLFRRKDEKEGRTQP